MARDKGRPKSENPANVQFRIRMTEGDAEKLRYCASKLSITMSEVVRKGIDIIYQGLEKK